MAISRRKFIELAGAFGATLALRSRYVCVSQIKSTERRDLFPQGVASGDPMADSVLVWTRRPPNGGSTAEKLIGWCQENR